MVGRHQRVSRLLDGREPDHGRDVPARTLRRGGRLRNRARSSPASGGCGRCTRSRRRSTSARATRFSAGSVGGLNYQIEHHLFPGAAHSLRAYRQDRPAQRRASRCPLRHASLVALSTPIALPTPAHDGTKWCPGHARDGLGPSGRLARRAIAAFSYGDRQTPWKLLPQRGGISTTLPRIAFERGLC